MNPYMSQTYIRDIYMYEMNVCMYVSFIDCNYSYKKSSYKIW